tara:strand:- start:18 stop:308 length:291 start_codon:yes stop_codon:yes gene_type:complete
MDRFSYCFQSENFTIKHPKFASQAQVFFWLGPSNDFHRSGRAADLLATALTEPALQPQQRRTHILPMPPPPPPRMVVVVVVVVVIVIVIFILEHRY